MKCNGIAWKMPRIVLFFFFIIYAVVSPEEFTLSVTSAVLQGVNTLTKDDQAGLANVGDLSDAEALDVDDTTDLEDEEYNEQSSDGETGRQADKRQLRKRLFALPVNYK